MTTSPAVARPSMACVRTNQIPDRKSTRLNSSHLVTSYAVFCLKKKIVYIPQVVVGRWWEHILHNQVALKLRTRLLLVPNVVAVSVPWRLTAFARQYGGDGPESH